MLKKVTEKGCVKQHVREGFINPHEIDNMLQTIIPVGCVDVNQVIDWVQVLNKSFIPQSGQTSTKNMQSIMLKIQSTIQEKELTMDHRHSILKSLRTLNLHQSHLSGGWRLLASPIDYKSILGLISKYRYINRILYNDRFTNPTLNACFYQLDLETIHSIKKTILVVQ